MIMSAGLRVATQGDMGPVIDLSEMTILFGSCFSHDFAWNLKTEMENWAQSNKMTVLGYPTIITAANEGSVAYTTHALTGQLKENAEAFRQQGSVTGADLMRRIQPKVYAFADIGFLSESDSSDESWREIGKQENLPKTSQRQSA